jgi:hypothetical protein
MVTGSKEFASFTRGDPEFRFIKDEDLLSNAKIYKSYRFAVDYGSKFYGDMLMLRNRRKKWSADITLPFIPVILTGVQIQKSLEKNGEIVRSVSLYIQPFPNE